MSNPAAALYAAQFSAVGADPAAAAAALQQQQAYAAQHAAQAAMAAHLRTFWAGQAAEMEAVTDFKNHNLPLARIKKIMKSDEDVRMISSEAPALFAKACEMFILEVRPRPRRVLRERAGCACAARTLVAHCALRSAPAVCTRAREAAVATASVQRARGGRAVRPTRVSKTLHIADVRAPAHPRTRAARTRAQLTLRSWQHSEENKRRTLQRSDIAAAISKTDIYDFLIDICPRHGQRRPCAPSCGDPRGFSCRADELRRPQGGGQGGGRGRRGRRRRRVGRFGRRRRRRIRGAATRHVPAAAGHDAAGRAGRVPPVMRIWRAHTPCFALLTHGDDHWRAQMRRGAVAYRRTRKDETRRATPTSVLFKERTRQFATTARRRRRTQHNKNEKAS